MAAKDVASRHIIDRLRLESDLLPLITKYPAVGRIVDRRVLADWYKTI